MSHYPNPLVPVHTSWPERSAAEPGSRDGVAAKAPPHRIARFQLESNIDGSAGTTARP
jgi:hypothetical protein